MNTAQISYAHMNATVNPKHVDSLLRFFEQGCTDASHEGYGVEIEHLPVSNADDAAVGYYGDAGIEVLLHRLRPFYDKSEEYWDNGRLVGLGREGVSVSLEPGAQLECSLGVIHRIDELRSLYRAFRSEVDPIADELGFRLVNYGYQPQSSWRDVRVNPKSRYDAMTDYLGRVGQYGLCMMRCSAATQISIDYCDERDALAKLRIGTAIGPITAWFFRNSPYFEGRDNPYPLLRQRMWDAIDPQRTGIIPGLYDERFGWEDYAVDVLSTPMMFADLTHTPEAADLPVAQQHRAAFRDNAAEVYPDREFNAYEINHVLSTHFNDVRLKNFVELRQWDSLPLPRVERLMEMVSSLFYRDEQFSRLTSYFDGVNELDVLAAKADLQAHGQDSKPYGQPLEFWKEFLGLEGLLSDVPGDDAHPEVFQA